MKQTLKNLCLPALFAAVIFLGCSEEEKSTTVTYEKVDPTGQSVVFWHASSKLHKEALDKIIADFNANNEWNITVEGEYTGYYSDIYNKMTTAIAGNTTPDLVVGYQSSAASFQLTDILVDIDKLKASNKWGFTAEDEEDFIQDFLAQDINPQFNNQRLGLPPNRSVQLTYYNKTWLNELGYNTPPESWEDFYEVCKAATESKEGSYGYAVYTDASNIFALVKSLGGSLMNEEKTAYTFNTPEMRETLGFMAQLYQDGYARKIAERYGDQSDFGVGKVMFTTSSSAGLPYYHQAVESGENPFEWDVYAGPHSTAIPTLNLYGPSVSICKSTPEKELAAWLFLKYFTGKEAQSKWVQATNYYPVRKSVKDELADYREANPQYADSFDILLNSKGYFEPPFIGWDEVRDLLSAGFNAILDGADIDKTLSQMEKEANEIMVESAP
jgi:multiple sugar transport system substrate-binding protein